MARIVYCHPRRTKYPYHIYTDLDFWDCRRILPGLAEVRRNFGNHPSGDEFPTQVVVADSDRPLAESIEKRLKKAIVSPPRHVIVRSMIFDGFFEFDPSKYFPEHWSMGRRMHFTIRRLPLQQAALCSPYYTVHLRWVSDRIRVERVLRERKYEPVIQSRRDARAHLIVPSCF